tara:strand:+ start:1490 stop:1990 length:501 start_codon:yes stop_codon:yes gene_type:complete
MINLRSHILFPPVVIGVGHLDLSDEWIEEVKAFCSDVGEREEPSSHATTYFTNRKVHEEPFIKQILDQAIRDEEEFLESWIQTYDKNSGFHAPHTHRGASVASCLYLNDGHGTYFYNQLQDTQENVPVKKGDILYWQPDLIHYSLPSTEEKTIIGMNIKTNREKIQ